MTSPPPLLAFAVLTPLCAPVAADDPVWGDVVQPFLARYCADCHGPEEPQADVVLTEFDGAASALAAGELFELVRELLEHEEMPPEGELAPTVAERERVLAWIDAELGPAVPESGPIDPGPAVLRRLNHSEYTNTVRDLFGIEFPTAERFPPDEVAHGFDTSGAALSLSQLLLERYLDAAAEIAARAIVIDDSAEPNSQRFDAAQMSGGRPRSGKRILTTVGQVWASVTPARSARYRVRVRASAQQAGPEPARMALLVDERELARFDVEAEVDAPQVYEAIVTLEGETTILAARFLNDYYRPEETDPRRRDRNLWVSWIEVEGPLEPPTPSAFQEELFARFPASLGRDRLESICEELLRVLWRRPAPRGQAGRLVRLVDEESSLEAQVRLALEALLSSPNFLFRVELDPPAEAGEEIRALDDWELASRLSYFLWSSTPDEELYRAATAGELSETDGYQHQVERLLSDPRSIALSEGFASQWLQLRSLDEATPDPERFPSWSAALRDSMREETISFFDTLLREERSLWELLEADWTMADERLANYYGVGGVQGETPRRISLAEHPRRGVLTHASVLTVTSNPTRTSPVLRGKWILDVLLGAPPPAPPPGADNLDESPEAISAASVRERLEQHRALPACAVCHDRMDPLGFGLEHFDAVGAYRERDGEHPIDSLGELPDGRRFEDSLGLTAMLREDGRLPRTLAERMLTYALGREMGRADRRAVDAVLADLDPDQPRLHELVLAVCRSELFTKRRAASRR